MAYGKNVKSIRKGAFESMDTNTMMENQTCPAVGYQTAGICVPVTVTPFAQTGATLTKCCGEPVISSGNAVCSGVRNGACAFTISQNICVAVPVQFGATATVGDMYVNCGGATAEDVCTNCSAVPPTEPVVPTDPTEPVAPAVPTDPVV